MQKPANWHQHRSDMTLNELLCQEALHEIDGRFPLTLSCESIGGDVLLEIIRKEDQLFAVFYFSEVGAEAWIRKFGFAFIDRNWQVIEGQRNFPYVVGKVGVRADPQSFADSIEEALEYLMPEEVRTGNFAEEGYLCPEA